ncbi:uncharacterized protein PAC_03517 [Phialocephala subalpina]|uniref:Uncharacterized protein n=1 Tax=Phialocephala subalpina TaxID=576137 RepID=A0A1L7WLI8_9HELO|nr:uncharacterized protein PAC_03517 [Phialocephala subalpina]
MSVILDPAHPFREIAVLKVASLVDVFFIMVIDRIERELNARAAAEEGPDEADQEAADERTGAEVDWSYATASQHKTNATQQTSILTLSWY